MDRERGEVWLLLNLLCVDNVQYVNISTSVKQNIYKKDQIPSQSAAFSLSLSLYIYIYIY